MLIAPTKAASGNPISCSDPVTRPPPYPLPPASTITATAACGPIGFVGLVVPHLARRIGGVDYRWVVPYSALLGALLLTVADIIGRVIVRPAELQVGIVMALVGGPVFVYLVRRTRMVSL